MKDTRSVMWVLGITVWFLVLVEPALASGPPPGAVVFDVDFTKGLAQLPAGARVTGGEWREGWRVTGNGQRVVIDAGYPLREGLLEVTLTRWDLPASAAAYLFPPIHRRTMPIGIFERETLGREDAPPGDAFRIQVGNGEKPRQIQGVIRAAVQEQGRNWRWMQEYGKWSDWVTDDRTPMTIRMEWRGGSAFLYDVTGKRWPCPKDCFGQMDNLRYVTLGGDGESEASAVGVRFLRARLVDLNKPFVASPPARRRLVYNVDLKKGPEALPATAAVLGGQWDGGWRVTGDGQRIVLDPGYHIRNGALELTMTRKRAAQKAQKINAFGLYEDPGIDQSDAHGDIFYVRIGMTEISQSVQGNVKAFVRTGLRPGADLAHEGMLWEQRFGKFADWKMDDTPVRIRMEWRGGTAMLTDINGNVLECPERCGGQMDALRYVVLGGDRYDGAGSLIGLRFQALRLIDFDAPE